MSRRSTLESIKKSVASSAKTGSVEKKEGTYPGARCRYCDQTHVINCDCEAYAERMGMMAYYHGMEVWD